MSEHSGFQVSGDAAKLREQYSVRYFIGPGAPGLVALAALLPGERVLDVACGTGLVTRLAAPEVGPTGHVTGVDISAAMLAVARSLPPPSGASITWVEGDAGAMDFPDASFGSFSRHTSSLSYRTPNSGARAQLHAFHHLACLYAVSPPARGW
ncbi:MAG: methyltransferase domain-containing protein [Betaproteobacteria bacterium]|nr:methyltransferase domain-containing protein [Betaproteobacteria bacterium]